MERARTYQIGLDGIIAQPLGDYGQEVGVGIKQNPKGEGNDGADIDMPRSELAECFIPTENGCDLIDRVHKLERHASLLLGLR